MVLSTHTFQQEQRDLVRFGVNCNWNGQVVHIYHGGLVTIYSNGQTIYSLSHIEAITLDENEEICSAAGR